MNHQARVSTLGWLAVLGSLALSTLGLGQDLTSGGPDSIIAGPFGEPSMVMSEGGEWSYPIKVFTNSDVETFVPDITSPGWISWHVAEFRQNGTYFTYLYIYNRKTRNTGRETVYVNTQNNTAVVVRPMSAPFRVDISKASLTFAKSVAKITALVTEETKSFHGQTVQKVIEQDEDLAVSQMCQQQGGCDPTIVRHSRTPPRLIPGAVPGVNCGVGTDRSCCCANDALASNTPTPASPLIAQPHSPVMTDGVYRIGNGVSAPILLSSVNAEFTDQARRAKYQGVCTLSVVIDSQGNPQNPHRTRTGYGAERESYRGSNEVAV